MHRLGLSAARRLAPLVLGRPAAARAASPATQQLLHHVPALQRPAPSRGYWTVRAIATPFPAAPLRKDAAVWARPAPAGPSPLLQAVERRVGALWQAYLRSLAQRPLLTKAITSAVCIIVGDSIAQAVGGAPYSVARVARLVAFSATIGTYVGHQWHRWLERTVPGRSPRAITTKVAFDQLLLSPLMTAVFFTSLKLMEGRPEAVLPFLAEKYLSTVATSMAVWTPYNALAFRFVPQDLRPAVGGLTGILWNCYLSISCLNGAPAACPGEAVAAALQAQGADG